MAEFRKTPNGPNTPGSAAYMSAIDPFRIAGNTYYVGISGQGSYLIVTTEGLILIEQPYSQEVGDKILRSIEKLGFKPADIKILTASEAHVDHMGATAYIKTATGAQLMLMEGDAGTVEKGVPGNSRRESRPRVARSGSDQAGRRGHHRLPYSGTYAGGHDIPLAGHREQSKIQHGGNLLLVEYAGVPQSRQRPAVSHHAASPQL